MNCNRVWVLLIRSVKRAGLSSRKVYMNMTFVLISRKAGLV
jgi:hypothetical protein